jgi:hypothetical protein
MAQLSNRRYRLRSLPVALLVAVLASPVASAGLRYEYLDRVPGMPTAYVIMAGMTYSMSSPCAEPPRFCYAKSQWIHAYVHCASRTVAIVELHSMDLNGDTFATLRPEAIAFTEPDRDSASITVLHAVCGDRRVDRGRWRRHGWDE